MVLLTHPAADHPSRRTCPELIPALLPVVHDELDPVPEGEGVAGVDDEPHDPRTHRRQGTAHDASLPGKHQLQPGGQNRFYFYPQGRGSPPPFRYV